MSRLAGWILACVPVFFMAVVSIAAWGPRAQSTGMSPRAAVEEYCVDCHSGSLKTAGLALDQMSVEQANQHPEVWEKVLRKLRPRHMPPPQAPRPDEATYDALVSSLEASLDRAAAAKPN